MDLFFLTALAAAQNDLGTIRLRTRRYSPESCRSRLRIAWAGTAGGISAVISASDPAKRGTSDRDSFAPNDRRASVRPRNNYGHSRLSSAGCADRDLDVVNVHGPVPTMSDAFLRLSNLLPSHARPATVYTHHSPIDIPGVGRMSARYNKLHESLALRADRIVTSGQYYATRQRSRYGPLVRAIPWGVDTRTSSQAFVPRSASKLRVLFVGQMRPYKGVETLLAAVAGRPWLELTLVGEGTELASYQRLADRLSATNVRFTGRLSDALRQALRELADDEARLEQLQIESWLGAQTRTWERCVTSYEYEEVLLDAVRCRYARMNGFAILPELDEQDRRQRGSHAGDSDLQPTKADVIRLGSRTRYVST